MKKQTTIPRLGTPDICTNYQELLRRGLKHCQDLGGDLWTDYNQHDPGVTILQQLCFALTDLSYRTDFDIPDILAATPDRKVPEQPLYTGDRILTCSPLTDSDYRKFLYDRVKGLKNAWLVPVKDHPLGVEGLYEILVETREEVEKDEARNIRMEVLQRMRGARNLGEDIEDVRILEPQKIRVEATIEVAPEVDPANVLAQVLFDIQNSLIPFPRVQLIDDLIREMPPDEIWNGPSLVHGALEQQSLIERKDSINVQEIAHIMLHVQGVKRVKHLKAGAPGELSSKIKTIQIREGHVPRLDPPILKPQPSYSIAIELEGGFKCQVDPRAVWAKIQELEASMRNNISYAARSLQANSYLQVPQGRNRHIEDYLSIQHQFPAVYGLGKYGIQGSLLEGDGLGFQSSGMQSNSLHEARVRQLKAYLLFFEQPMADYLAQLAHVAHLFSLEEQPHSTYFHQEVAHEPARPSDPPNILDVLAQHAAAPRSRAHYLTYVVDPRGEIVFVTRRLAGESEAREMRQRIIDAGRHSRHYRTSMTAGNEVQLALHDHAGTFLALGQERFTSAAAAREGTERWAHFMSDLLGKKQLQEKFVKIFRREELSVQIIDDQSRIVLVSNRVQTREEREGRIADILACGLNRRNYEFHAAVTGGYTIHLRNTRGESIADGEELFAAEFDAEEGVDALIALLRRMAQQESIRERHLRRLPEVEELSKDPLQSYREGLRKIGLHVDRDYLRRRNRFLNHLLARFGEHFDDHILERLDLRPFGEKDPFFEELIRWKTEFLRDYVARENEEDTGVSLGAARALGFNYADDSGTLSGLERRVSLLLGLHGHSESSGYFLQQSQQAPSDPGFFCLEKYVWPPEPEKRHDERGLHVDVPRHRITGPWEEGEPDLNDLHHNFVFSSEDSSILKQLLSAGQNRENYRLHAVGSEYHVLFQSPHSGESITIHHARSKTEAEGARDDLVHYFQELTETASQSYAGERMHVLEHILLRPHGDAGKSCLHIADPESGFRLRSSIVERPGKADHLELILRHGQHTGNYRIQRDASGKNFVALLHEGREIAAGTQPFDNEQQAAAAIARLAEIVLSLLQQPGPRKKHAHEAVADDFFSHRVSVFLPNWPARFQNSEFRLYAEQLIQENAPAHLAVAVFWLTVHEMTEFEKLHGDWKALKRALHLQEAHDSTGSATALNEAANRLKDLVERLQARQRNAGLPRPEDSQAGKP
ncbi:MAG: hypothetical protein LAP21_11530 [Acidobacteriia bacterium]|nr:hypothetical protein [Terriglobia bacterium]